MFTICVPCASPQVPHLSFLTETVPSLISLLIWEQSLFSYSKSFVEGCLRARHAKEASTQN